MKIELEILSKNIVEIMIEKNFIVSTVESCTGGGLASSIIDISGASNVLKEAFVTYSNESKIKNIGVDSNLIKNYGVVSKEVAIDMARKLRGLTNCDIAISTTGNLGPETLEDKDIGLVYIGFSTKNEENAVECRFNGNRTNIKEQVIYKALDTLYRLIVK